MSTKTLIVLDGEIFGGVGEGGGGVEWKQNELSTSKELEIITCRVFRDYNNSVVIKAFWRVKLFYFSKLNFGTTFFIMKRNET